MVFTIITMVINILVNGWKIKKMVKVHTNTTVQVMYTLENGVKMQNMVEEHINIAMEIYMRVIS